MNPRHFTSLSAAVLTAGLLAGCGSTPGAQRAGPNLDTQQVTPQDFQTTSLGIPLTDVLVLGGVVAPGPNGQPALWVATGGKPAHLNAIDPLTGDVLFSAPLKHPGDDGYGEGGYAVTATPDGTVYVGTYYDGHLYRRAPGPDSTLEDLGQAIAGDTYIWRLAVTNGRVYGGTYSGGRVFEFDPATRTFRNLGQPVPGEKYVRSVAAAGGLVYAGSQPTTHIVEMNPATGENRELPLPAGASGTVNDLNVHGRLLYARIGSSIINATLHVYDLEAGQWVASIPNVAGLDVPAPGPDGKVYVTVTDGAKGELASFDPATRQLTRLGVFIPGRVSNSRGVGWVTLNDPAWPGQTLAQMLWRGAVLLYNPATGNSRFLQSGVKGEPIGIWSMAAGATNIYLGGYLNGGLGVYDTTTEKTTYNRFAQIESIYEDRNTVWLGTYPDARSWKYDLLKPWNNAAYSPTQVGGEENPVLVHDGKPQDQIRVFGLADVGTHMAFGTQGGTTLTGTLRLTEKTTGATTVYPSPAPDQGIVTLEGRNGLLYGGTTIYGAYSVPTPVTTSGQLFAWNPDTHAVEWMITPRANQAAVTDIAFDRRGKLWNIVNGSVQVRNARNGDLQREFVLAPDSGAGSLRGDLVYDPGRDVMWALVQQRQLWQIDARSGRSVLVMEGEKLNHITVHASGDVYVARDAELLRIRRAP